MENPEMVLFILAALVAGGLTMGGVTLVYFRDKWREDPPRPTDAARHDQAESGPCRRRPRAGRQG